MLRKNSIIITLKAHQTPMELLRISTKHKFPAHYMNLSMVAGLRVRARRNASIVNLKKSVLSTDNNQIVLICFKNLQKHLSVGRALRFITMQMAQLSAMKKVSQRKPFTSPKKLDNSYLTALPMVLTLIQFVAPNLHLNL